MSRSINFTVRAWEDLFSIYDYIALNDSESRADKIIKGLQKVCSELDQMAERGHFPPELEGHQQGDFRELRFKPYRILYRIGSSRVDVLAVFDGRRDARSLIEQRAFRS